MFVILKVLMKIFIIGASGTLGKALYKELSNKYEVFGTYNKKKINGFLKFDISKDNITKKLHLKKNDIVIYLAGITRPSKVNRNLEKSKKINLTNTKKIINKLNKIKVKFFYLSSVEVFDCKNKILGENFKQNPKTVYGKQKYEIENYLKENVKNYQIIRTGSVVTFEKNEPCPISITHKILRNKHSKVFKNNFISITSIDDFVKIFKMILSKKEFFRKKIVHISSNLFISRIQLANEIKRISKYKKIMNYDKIDIKKFKSLKNIGINKILLSNHKFIREFKFNSIKSIIRKKIKEIERDEK